MADLVDRIRKELDARIAQLRPLVSEFERLQRAAAALASAGTRSLPGRRPRAAAPAAARAARRRADGSPGAKPAARKPSRTRRAGTSGPKPAPRGQTQAKVLAALRAAPGSTTATIAKTAGIPANTAAATISRLVKQGRVRRLEEGGYATVETPAGDASMTTAPTPAASDTPGAQAPASTETPTAQ